MIKKVIMIIICSILGVLLWTSEVYAYDNEQESIEEIEYRNQQLYISSQSYQLKNENLEYKLWLNYGEIPTIVDIKRNNKALYLYWNKVECATGYIVYKKLLGRDWFKVAHFTNKESLCYVDKNYYNNCVYNDAFYTVIAYKNINNMEMYSKVDKEGVCYLETPIISNLSVNNIKWNKVKYADGYEILSRNADEKSWKVINTVDENSNEYVIRSKEYSDNKYYTVRAYKNTTNSRVYSKCDSKITLKNRKYRGENIIFEGDSTTSGIASQSYLEVIYPARVGQLLGANIQVNAAPDEVASTIAKKISYREKYFNDANLVCLAIGSSDYEIGTILGNIVDETTDTFYGALSYIIKIIREQNPKAKVLLITPFYRGKYINKINVNCNFKKNKVGCTLQDYVDAIKSVAYIYRCNIYDANSEGPLSLNNVSYATYDYVNPTEEYHSKIGSELTEYIVKNKLL
ncbi:MAG: SGNH/GDSL hydrolase family protein [Lachnospiraceae bacterium]|nr:SGNH/GDSL hydrolase family protein [Lachnospiraceae bacterium]